MEKFLVSALAMFALVGTLYAVNNQVRLPSGTTKSNPGIAYATVIVSTDTTLTGSVAATAYGVRRRFCNTTANAARIKYGSATNCATTGIVLPANSTITEDNYFGITYFSANVLGSSTTVIIETLTTR